MSPSQSGGMNSEPMREYASAPAASMASAPASTKTGNRSANRSTGAYSAASTRRAGFRCSGPIRPRTK